MTRLIFFLFIYMIGMGIYYAAGKNKRQLREVPQGMYILCMPPQIRFTVYALSIFLFLFVMSFATICILSGGAEDAGIWLIICIVLAFVMLGVGGIFGYVCFKNRVCFNDDKIQIDRAFAQSKTFFWYEVTNVKFKKDSFIILYDIDGNVILKADCNMLNYDIFSQKVRKIIS